MLTDGTGPFRTIVLAQCPWSRALLESGVEGDKDALVVLLLAALADTWLKADVEDLGDAHAYPTGLQGHALLIAKECAHCAYGFSVLRWLGRIGQSPMYGGVYSSMRDMLDRIKVLKMGGAKRWLEEHADGQQKGGVVHVQYCGYGRGGGVTEARPVAAFGGTVIQDAFLSDAGVATAGRLVAGLRLARHQHKFGIDDPARPGYAILPADPGAVEAAVEAAEAAAAAAAAAAAVAEPKKPGGQLGSKRGTYKCKICGKPKDGATDHKACRPAGGRTAGGQLGRPGGHLGSSKRGTYMCKTCGKPKDGATDHKACNAGRKLGSKRGTYTCKTCGEPKDGATDHKACNAGRKKLRK